MFRNVGQLMKTDAITLDDRSEVFEGILDAIITVGCAIVNHRQQKQLLNSRFGSIYIVKPKLHGPGEAALTNSLFCAVEDLYGLARNTVKIGLMDEERRTTVNLQECIRALRDRIVFINTGFLDRTGDEIRTNTFAGPVPPKARIRQQHWLAAYERSNVDVGLRSGFAGRAQIGKGMWAKPDCLDEMQRTKMADLEAGATCAWVPSPTAATIHAMHYHDVDVAAVQRSLAGRPAPSSNDLLSPATCSIDTLDADTIQRELDNCAQGILGYVVRWVDDGIGCSKVPDIEGVGLMEDRATLRISSQLIANWLLHEVCNADQVRETFERMALVVDEQNASVPGYRPLGDSPESSLAYQAALALVFDGIQQPNGYTEPLLHAFRRKKKTDSVG